MSLSQVSVKLAAASSDDIVVRDEAAVDVLAKTQQVAIESHNVQFDILLRMEEILMQIADNVYNIAGKIGAQVTSLQTVRDYMVMDRQLEAKQDSQEELAAIEQSREEEQDELDPKKSEKMSYLEQFFKQLNGILRVFTALLVPMAVGAFLRLREWVSENFGDMAKKIMDIGTVIAGVLLIFRKAVFSLFSKVATLTTAIVKNLDKVLPAIRGALGVLGRIASKIALPLTIAMGLWDAITSAMEGYEKNGITGAIREGLAGLTAGLIGWVGDLGAWAIGSLMQMVGMEDLGSAVKEFDFTGFVRDTVGQMYDFVTGYLTSWKESMGAAFDQLLSGNLIGSIMAVVASPFKGLYDGLTEALKVDPAQMMKQTFLELAPPGSLLDWVIPDAAYRALGVDPETGDPLPPAPKSTMKEVARELFLKYAPVGGYLDYVIPDSVYRALGIDPSSGEIIQDLPQSIDAITAAQMMQTTGQMVEASTLEPVFVEPSSVRPGEKSRVDRILERSVERAESSIYGQQPNLSIIGADPLQVMAIPQAPGALSEASTLMPSAANQTAVVSSRMVTASEVVAAARSRPAQAAVAGGSMSIAAPVMNTVNNQTALMGPLTAVGNQFGVGLF